MSEQLAMYFNTNDLSYTEQLEAQKRVFGQNRKVLEFFRSNPRRNFTPFEVQRLGNINAPITSIRRALNTLTRHGYLVKTNIMREGDYGSPNHTWQLS
ncbi:MAG: hypothetical protein JRJ57_00330 [Deltaproteobacteria bacterium]|nr:hypothetical protein [Deltaproteobacteria bacterium]